MDIISPIQEIQSGTVKEVVEVPGYYFSIPYLDDKHLQLNYVLGYLSHVAARKIVYIESNDPNIGIMAYIPLGMSDVSTIQLTVEKGSVVKKGQDIGAFHFGGSSYLMVFRKASNLKFINMDEEIKHMANLEINSKLAFVGLK